MTSLTQPARAFVDPLDGVRVAVEARRWAWPLLLLCLAVSASGTAFSLRWDAAPAVMRQLQSSGELGRLSETEIDENIQTAGRRALVGGIAKGLFVMPMMALALAVVLWIAGWLFGTPAAFGRCMSAATIALLPVALYHLLFAACALYQHGMSEAQIPRLLPSHLGLLSGLTPKVQRVLSAVDFFNLWSTCLLGLGFSAASGMRRGRALLLALTLYFMYAGVFMVGLPGMSGGMGGGAR